MNNLSIARPHKNYNVTIRGNNKRYGTYTNRLRIKATTKQPYDATFDFGGQVLNSRRTWRTKKIVYVQ